MSTSLRMKISSHWTACFVESKRNLAHSEEGQFEAFHAEISLAVCFDESKRNLDHLEEGQNLVVACDAVGQFVALCAQKKNCLLEEEQHEASHAEQLIGSKKEQDCCLVLTFP